MPAGSGLSDCRLDIDCFLKVQQESNIMHDMMLADPLIQGFDCDSFANCQLVAKCHVVSFFAWFSGLQCPQSQPPGELPEDFMEPSECRGWSNRRRLFLVRKGSNSVTERSKELDVLIWYCLSNKLNSPGNCGACFQMQARTV